MTTHAISVVLCTYNGERFLPELLASVQRQSLPPAELIWCDDGSSDATVEIAQKFIKTATFPVRFSINPHKLGPMKNFSHALSRVTGTHVALCDQDDSWLPEKLARLADCFSDPNVKLVYSDSLLVDENLNSLGQVFLKRRGVGHFKKDSLPYLLFQNTVSGCACMFDAELLSVALPIPDEAIMHDWWIALIASAHGEVKHINAVTILYRQHGGNVLGGSAGRYSAENLRASGVPFGLRREAQRKFTASANQAIALRGRLEKSRVPPPESLSAFVKALDKSRPELWQTCRRFDIQRGDWIRNLSFTLGLFSHDSNTLIRN